MVEIEKFEEELLKIANEAKNCLKLTKRMKCQLS